MQTSLDRYVDGDMNMNTLEHLTLLTGHLRHSPRREVGNDIIGILRPTVIAGAGKLGDTGWSLQMVDGSVLLQRLIGSAKRPVRGQLCGKNFELLGQGRIRIEGVSRLSFAHHMDHLDAGQDDRG